MNGWKNGASQPIMSICCLAYNQERFLSAAIDGFLMQKTTFPFEILIHDDASTDSTTEIIRDYEKKYPHIVKPIYQKKNLYSRGERIFAPHLYPRARGKYIAFCEGDDYWTDPLKLQKQVDLIEKDPDISMCFHSVMILNENNNHIYPEREAQDRYYSIDELLLSRIAHTTSFVVKKSLLNKELMSNQLIFGGDMITTLIMAEAGKVYGMKDRMAVYRIHRGGITSIVKSQGGIENEKRLLKQYIFIKKNFKSLSSKAAKARIVDHCAAVFTYYRKQNDLNAVKYLLLAIYYNPRLILKTVSKFIKRK